MSSLRLGILQMRSGLAPADNLPAFSDGVAALAGQGAALLCTPEMTGALDGRRGGILSTATTEDADPLLARARALAAEHRLWINIGSLAIRPTAGSERLVNRQYMIDPQGAIAARYDKIHLFDVDLPSGERYRESNTYQPGAQAVAVRTPWAVLGMTICYDLRFAYLYRALAQAGAGLIVVPAAFTQVTGQAHWHVLLRARAIETGCFIIAAAQSGTHADGRTTYGHSLVVAPWGEVVLDGGTEPGPLVVDIELSQISEARGRVPALTHDRPTGPVLVV